MKRTFRRILAALPILFGFALFTASAYAQSTFVYTDDNNLGPNTVSAFSVGPGGTLMMVPGSPFPTGGTGGGFDHSPHTVFPPELDETSFMLPTVEAMTSVLSKSIRPRGG